VLLDRGPILGRLMDLPTINLGLLVPLAGFLMLLLAAAITIRISRGEGDAVGRWRYRESRGAVPRAVPARPRPDVQASRRMSRLLLGVAIGYILLAVVLWVGRPGFMGSDGGAQLGADAAGLATMLFGLGWMIRIYRADPEPDDPAWRYRSEF
jgi:hypothetical protein